MIPHDLHLINRECFDSCQHPQSFQVAFHCLIALCLFAFNNVMVHYASKLHKTLEAIGIIIVQSFFPAFQSNDLNMITRTSYTQIRLYQRIWLKCPHGALPRRIPAGDSVA